MVYVISANTKGGIGKWILALTEFDLKYESAKAVNAQGIADFVTQHCDQTLGFVQPLPWTLFCNRYSCKQGCGVDLVLILHRGQISSFLIP